MSKIISVVGIGNKSVEAIAAASMKRIDAAPIRLQDLTQTACPVMGCNGKIVKYRMFATKKDGEAIARNEQGACNECGQKTWTKQWFNALTVDADEFGDEAVDLSAE